MFGAVSYAVAVDLECVGLAVHIPLRSLRY